MNPDAVKIKPDKYSAIWVSHSSMGDFLKCPRLYYLHNVYKDPITKNKISIVSPHMSLGVAVHEVLEGLAEFPAETRMQQDLLSNFEMEWEKVKGKKGGFKTGEEEAEFKARGVKMLQTVIANPRFLLNKRIKLPKGEMNPNFYLSEDENIILNGLVDWIEYLPDDTLHIIDFKTGKKEETDGSLQLPIYLLLCHNLQGRKVSKASYWYLETDNLVSKELPPHNDCLKDVMDVALRVKEARVKNEFKCPKGLYNPSSGAGGCMHCRPYEAILAGKAEFVGTGGFKQDLYIL